MRQAPPALSRRASAVLVIASISVVSAAWVHASNYDISPASQLNAVGALLPYSKPANNWIANTAEKETQQGTIMNDQFQGVGGDTLIGGLGDDTYILWDRDNKIIEKPGEGIDTVESYIDLATVLPDNVENLVLKGNNSIFGIGNALDNIITASSAGATLDGRAGNDILIGGSGADIFQISAGNGSDTIIGFTPGVDKIRLGGYPFFSFSQLNKAIHQVGPDVIIKLSISEKLVVRGITVSALTTDDFQLPVDTSTFKDPFREEFSKLTMRANGGIWFPNYGLGGSADHALPGEQEVYVDPSYTGSGTQQLGLNPYSVSADGILSIIAAPASPKALPALNGAVYTSGLLSSKDAFSQEYGYFEIRAALPAKTGCLPEFWLMPEAGGWPPEIDIMESLGKNPSVIYMTTHNLGGVTIGAQTYIDHPERMHTYGLNWTKDLLTWYVDGINMAQQRTPRNMHQEFFAILNMAIGNDWAGKVSASTGICVFKVDYLHIYANNDTVSRTIRGSKISWQKNSGDNHQ